MNGQTELDKTCRQINGLMDIKINRWIDSQTGKWMGRQKNGWMDGWTGGRVDNDCSNGWMIDG